MSDYIPTVSVARQILLIRGQKVMIDMDLAELYGVETKALNQAVKRNKKRFPTDFMFQLTEEEKKNVVTNCDHLSRLKFSSTLPHVFTEHGALMLGNILTSPRAIEISLFIVRTFVQLREMHSAHKELAIKLEDLERKVGDHDEAIVNLIEAIRQLMQPLAQTKHRIGFESRHVE